MREVIVYTSKTCVPCQTLKPQLLILQKAHGFKLKFIELSLETKDVFVEMGIRSVPVTACVEDKKVVGMFSGLKMGEDLYSELKSWGVLEKLT